MMFNQWLLSSVKRRPTGLVSVGLIFSCLSFANPTPSPHRINDEGLLKRISPDCGQHNASKTACYRIPLVASPPEKVRITPVHHRTQRSARSSSGSGLLPEDENTLPAEQQKYINSHCNGESFARVVSVNSNDDLKDTIYSYIKKDRENYQPEYWVDFTPEASSPWRYTDVSQGILFLLPPDSVYTTSSLQLSFVDTNPETNSPSSPRIGICGLTADPLHQPRLVLNDRSSHRGGGVPQLAGLDGSHAVWVGPLLILQSQVELYHLTIDGDGTYNKHTTSGPYNGHYSSLPSIQMHKGGKLLLRNVTGFRNQGDLPTYEGLIYSSSSFLQILSSDLTQTTSQGSTIFSARSVTRIFDTRFQAENTVCPATSSEGAVTEIHNSHFIGNDQPQEHLPTAHASYPIPSAYDLCNTETTLFCQSHPDEMYPDPHRPCPIPGGCYCAALFGDCYCDQYLPICEYNTNELTFRGNHFSNHWNNLLFTFQDNITDLSTSNLVSGEFNRCASEESNTLSGDMQYTKDGITDQCVYPSISYTEAPDEINTTATAAVEPRLNQSSSADTSVSNRMMILLTATLALYQMVRN